MDSELDSCLDECIYDYDNCIHECGPSSFTSSKRHRCYEDCKLEFDICRDKCKMEYLADIIQSLLEDSDEDEEDDEDDED